MDGSGNADPAVQSDVGRCHYPGCRRPSRPDSATGRPSLYCEQSDPEGGPVHNRANAWRQRRAEKSISPGRQEATTAPASRGRASFEEQVARLPDKFAELSALLDQLAADARAASIVADAGPKVGDAHRETFGKVTEADRRAATERTRPPTEERSATGLRQHKKADAAAAEVVHQTERWFVHRGMATMIEDYRFTEHVLPRMLPSLALMASLASLAWLVPLEGPGSGRWALLAVVVVVIIAARVMAGLAGRHLPRFSRIATVVLLSAYAVMPVAVPVIQLAVTGHMTPPGGHAIGAVGFVIFFAVVFVATLLGTTYSVGALLVRAIRRTVFDMRNSVRRLLGWALPLLLIANVFLFFTGELWQAMNRLSWLRLSLVVAVFVAITILAAANRLREETSRVEQELNPRRLSVAAAGTPVAEISTEELARKGQLQATPLNGHQQRNLLVMLATRQLAQAAVVGVALLVFFIVMGLIVVTPETASQWIGSQPAPSVIPGVPVALLRNAALFAAFGSMLFAVTSMSDDEYRRQFFAPIIDEIESTLAVRTIYLAVKNRPDLVGH